MNTKDSNNEIREMFESFQQTGFYRWLDRGVTGPWKWIILPVTGIIDAFVVVIPTELVLVLYLMRNDKSSWWIQTLITSLFAGVGYVILAVIVSLFGIDAVSWLVGIAGEDLANTLTGTLSAYIVLFAVSAGITSIFPMPMTAFAVSAGLFGWSLPLLFMGAVIGKFVRFGIFAYGTRRWGNELIEWYFRNANTVSLVLIALIVGYLWVQ